MPGAAATAYLLGLEYEVQWFDLRSCIKNQLRILIQFHARNGLYIPRREDAQAVGYVGIVGLLLNNANAWLANRNIIYELRCTAVEANIHMLNTTTQQWIGLNPRSYKLEESCTWNDIGKANSSSEEIGPLVTQHIPGDRLTRFHEGVSCRKFVVYQFHLYVVRPRVLSAAVNHRNILKLQVQGAEGILGRRQNRCRAANSGLRGYLQSGRATSNIDPVIVELGKTGSERPQRIAIVGKKTAVFGDAVVLHTSESDVVFHPYNFHFQIVEVEGIARSCCFQCARVFVEECFVDLDVVNGIGRIQQTVNNQHFFPWRVDVDRVIAGRYKKEQATKG